MELICQRCGAGLLSDDAAFCSNCGLPQLRISEDAITPADEPAGQERTELRASKPVGNMRADWRYALRCAITVAAPAGILMIFASRSELATLLLFLWIIGAAMLAVVLYHRGRPALPLSFKMGARIGATTGTLMAGILFFIFAVTAFTMRFHEHSSEMDNAYRERIEQVAAQQKLTPELEQLFRSPEGKAGVMVGGCVFYGLILIGMCTITGATGGALLRTERFTSR